MEEICGNIIAAILLPSLAFAFLHALHKEAEKTMRPAPVMTTSAER